MSFTPDVLTDVPGKPGRFWGDHTTFVGPSRPPAWLLRLLGRRWADNVRTSFHRDVGLPTTVKLRVIGRQQQLLRIDFETAPSHEILATKLADYERLLADTDVVILSDTSQWDNNSEIRLN